MDKESKFLELLKNLEPWQIFIVAILIIAAYIVIKTDLLGKLFNNRQNEEIAKLKQDEADRKIQEEIKRIKEEFAERAFKNIEQAAHHAVESLEHCIGANYYVIHDSGEDLREVKNWYLAVLRSTSFAVGTDYAEPVLVNKGFRWFNENVRDKMFFYVADIPNSEIDGIDGEYCQAMGIKAVAGAVVRNEGSVYHHVSLNFDISNPKEINENVRGVIFEFKRAVATNI